MPLLILGTNNDDEYAQLVALGYSGSLNDMQFKYLSSLGYTGSLADKIFSHLTQPVVSLSVSASSIIEGQSQGTALLTFTPQNASNPSDVTLSGITPSNAVQMNADGVTLEAGSYTLTFSTDIAVTFTASFTDDNGSYDFPITLPVAQNGVPVGGPFDLTFDVTADETPPSISSTSPADNATDVAVDAAITITFSEPIAFDTGNIILRENNSGWSDLETFDVTTDVGTSPGQVSISGNTLTITPTSNRSNSLEYAIRIDSGAITDIGGVAFTGIMDDTSFSFTTVAASAGLAVSSQGQLINSSTPGTSFTSDTTITLSAGDMLVIEYGTCRNTGLSAMDPTMTWNGEALTESVKILHSAGRITSHVLTLVAASSATSSVSINLSNSAAAQSGRYYIVTGQSGTPVKQTVSNQILSGVGGPLSLDWPSAVNNGALIFGGAMARYSTGGVTSLTADSPYTQDTNIQTNVSPSSNLDGVFASGHFTTVSTTAPTTTFTPDVNCNICAAGIEVF